MEVKSAETGSANAVKHYKPFRTAAVLGAGVMGAQIAAHLANAGLQVHLLDIAPKEGKKNSIVEAAFKRASKLKPKPFFNAAAKSRITLGNFDEHFDRLADVDWVIEVVIENMDIKRSVMERIEATVRPDTVVTSNTSGLPIGEISQGRSADFKSRFMGTHFFNPPRYLKLFEVIPTPDTDLEILERVKHFGRVHLGKGVVVAKDTPNFIGNRIGTYAMMQSVLGMVNDGYTIEEVDALTGSLIGRPKSATFRTSDVVGLDTFAFVSKNLYDLIPHDESRDVFLVPKSLEKLIESGALGQKVGRGFYKKEGRNILSVNLDTMEYEEAKPFDLGDLKSLKRAGGLKKRLQALYADEGRAGAFFRKTTLETLSYSTRRMPEITENPANIDRAVCWGYGWKAGPFAMWDMIGFDKIYDDITAAGQVMPAWVSQMKASGATSFYRTENGINQIYIPGEGYVADESYADQISLNYIKSDAKNTIFSNSDGALLDLGNQVAIFEFRSKANSLGTELVKGFNEALNIVEDGDWRGMVVGNEGGNFSVGANIGEMAMGAAMGQFDQISDMIKGFQSTIQRIRYASKPVVVAGHSKMLGGACEMLMACPNPVIAAETYAGLVEIGVGLIPGGTGTMMMAARASELAASSHPSHIAPFLQEAFQSLAMARVAMSGEEARDLGFMGKNGTVVMHSERRFHVAKEKVIGLSNEGYRAPAYRNAINVLGRPGAAPFAVGVYGMQQSRYASEYDRFLANKLGYILTGGDLSGPSVVDEQYLLDLEREVFLSLLGEEKTMARIQHILETNKPLRN